MTFKEWDELTVHEKIASFPARHPWTFRCMLYLYITTGVPWEAIITVMHQMGYILMDLRLDVGGGMSIGAPTYLAEDSYTPEDIEER